VAGLTLPQVIGVAMMAAGGAVIVSRRGRPPEPARAAA
jgi:hypothetical protein